MYYMERPVLALVHHVAVVVAGGGGGGSGSRWSADHPRWRFGVNGVSSTILLRTSTAAMIRFRIRLRFGTRILNSLHRCRSWTVRCKRRSWRSWCSSPSAPMRASSITSATIASNCVRRTSSWYNTCAWLIWSALRWFCLRRSSRRSRASGKEESVSATSPASSTSLSGYNMSSCLPCSRYHRSPFRPDP